MLYNNNNNGVPLLHSNNESKIMLILLDGHDIKEYNKILPSFEARLKNMISTELEHNKILKKTMSDKEVALVLTKDFQAVFKFFKV